MTQAQADLKPAELIGAFESLADPIRLRLLRLLDRHELGVAELCGIHQLPQSTVSRHLKTLVDAGWLSSHRQGTNHLYRLVMDELEPPTRRLWMVAREQTQDWPAVVQDRLRLARRLRERHRDSRAFFAGAAAEWDKLRGELYGNTFSTAAMLSLLPHDSIVADLGCGTGQLAETLAQYVGRVIGVDNSTAMLKAARKRTASLPNVDLRPGELEALPIDAATCDAALLLLALTYVQEPAAVLREVGRILKPAGRIVVVDLLPHDREDFRRQLGQTTLGLDPLEIERMLQDTGFVAPKIHPIPPEPNVKGPALFLATAEKTQS